MATEILRPTAASYAMSQCTMYPSSISVDDVETVINETTADDDATYVQTSSALARIDCYFDSDLLRANYTKISTCNIIFRVKNTSGEMNINCSLRSDNNSSADAEQIEVMNTVTQSTEWETKVISFDKTNVIAAIAGALNNTEASGPLLFRLAGIPTDTSSKNSNAACITQVYVEITYADDGTDTTTETIYLKENGSWTAIPCIIYQKQNGSWVATDSSIFTSGDKFNLQEIT